MKHTALLSVLFSVVFFSAAFTNSVSAQEEAAVPEIEASDIDALNEAIGKEVAVKGTIVRVGQTQGGGITFLNFSRQKGANFVGVVFQKSYGAFPDGFEKFTGKDVIIRGVLQLFKNEQPQIEITTPDQIQEVTAE